ncbi:uncharacterized protein BDW70DRAFT_163690 [Aspergillus foveolatus]|uniref:uncharacterized protein n=1 Tax=Aspergillus foveolatus TaxID=210207 RepID=UPI003CCD020B
MNIPRAADLRAIEKSPTGSPQQMPTLNRVDVKSYVRHVGPVACVRPESEVRALGSAPAPRAQIPSQGLTALWHPLLAKRLKLGSLGSCLPTRSAGHPGTGLSEDFEQNSNTRIPTPNTIPSAPEYGSI